MQMPLTQESVVQASLSSQAIWVKTQLPLMHVSIVQSLRSLQTSVSHGLLHPGMGMKMQVPLVQESVVQMSPSSHTIGVKMHTPAAQESLVHGSPSSQNEMLKLVVTTESQPFAEIKVSK